MSTWHMSKPHPDRETDDEMTPQELLLLERVESTLAVGLELKEWWAKTYAADAFAERFEETVSFNRPQCSFGFFDQAPIGSKEMPLMGNFQSMYYDQPKARPAQQGVATDWMREQVREFVLQYFMRVSDFRLPQAFSPANREPLPAYLRPFSWCPSGDPEIGGFGFSQCFFKLKETGEVGKFPISEQDAIIDLRELGEKYEWIVAKVRIFDFNLAFKPLGETGPQLTFPLNDEFSYLVLSRDFITEDNEPEPGELARFGLGYAFVKNPAPSLVAYGPGDFEAAFQTIDFHVQENGIVKVDMAFVSNQPERILGLSLDTIGWGLKMMDVASLGMSSRLTQPWRDQRGRGATRSFGVDPIFGTISLLNTLTGGAAGRTLCISKKELLKSFLLQHFMQHFKTVTGSLQTWRQIPDWLDHQSLPEWVKTGRSA